MSKTEKFWLESLQQLSSSPYKMISNIISKKCLTPKGKLANDEMYTEHLAQGMLLTKQLVKAYQNSFKKHERRIKILMDKPNPKNWKKISKIKKKKDAEREQIKRLKERLPQMARALIIQRREVSTKKKKLESEHMLAPDTTGNLAPCSSALTTRSTTTMILRRRKPMSESQVSQKKKPRATRCSTLPSDPCCERATKPSNSMKNLRHKSRRLRDRLTGKFLRKCTVNETPSREENVATTKISIADTITSSERNMHIVDSDMNSSLAPQEKNDSAALSKDCCSGTQGSEIRGLSPQTHFETYPPQISERHLYLRDKFPYILEEKLLNSSTENIINGSRQGCSATSCVRKLDNKSIFLGKLQLVNSTELESINLEKAEKWELLGSPESKSNNFGLQPRNTCFTSGECSDITRKITEGAPIMSLVEAAKHVFMSRKRVCPFTSEVPLKHPTSQSYSKVSSHLTKDNDANFQAKRRRINSEDGSIDMPDLKSANSSQNYLKTYSAEERHCGSVSAIKCPCITAEEMLTASQNENGKPGSSSQDLLNTSSVQMSDSTLQRHRIAEEGSHCTDRIMKISDITSSKVCPITSSTRATENIHVPTKKVQQRTSEDYSYNLKLLAYTALQADIEPHSISTAHNTGLQRKKLLFTPDNVRNDILELSSNSISQQDCPKIYGFRTSSNDYVSSTKFPCVTSGKRLTISLNEINNTSLGGCLQFPAACATAEKIESMNQQSSETTISSSFQISPAEAQSNNAVLQIDPPLHEAEYLSTDFLKNSKSTCFRSGTEMLPLKAAPHSDSTATTKYQHYTSNQSLEGALSDVVHNSLQDHSDVSPAALDKVSNLPSELSRVPNRNTRTPLNQSEDPVLLLHNESRNISASALLLRNNNMRSEIKASTTLSTNFDSEQTHKNSNNKNQLCSPCLDCSEDGNPSFCENLAYHSEQDKANQQNIISAFHSAQAKISSFIFDLYVSETITTSFSMENSSDISTNSITPRNPSSKKPHDTDLEKESKCTPCSSEHKCTAQSSVQGEESPSVWVANSEQRSLLEQIRMLVLTPASSALTPAIWPSKAYILKKKGENELPFILHMPEEDSTSSNMTRTALNQK